jgi:hypothetical protein
MAARRLASEVQSFDQCCVPQPNPFHSCPAAQEVLVTTHEPPLRERPGGQIAHGPFTHRMGRWTSVIEGFAFRNGCQKVRPTFFSCTAFSRGDNFEDGELDVLVRVLAKCDAELLELWALDELDAPECDADELDPPEELL